MKILLFCHLGQILEYAEYIRAFRKIRRVEAVLLTMGQDEYDLASRTGEFHAVKDILPSSAELDRSDIDESLASLSLRELEQRLGFNFVNRDILTDRWFGMQSLRTIDSSVAPQIWSGPRTRQFMYLLYKRLDEEIAAFSSGVLFVETSFAPTRMAWRLAREKGIPAGGFMAVRFWQDRLYFETGIGYDWHEARTAYADLKLNPVLGDELAIVRDRLHAIRVAKAKPAYLQTDHAKGAPGFLERVRTVRLFTGDGGWLGSRSRTFTVNPQVFPPQSFSPWSKIRRYMSGQRAKRFLLKHETPFSAFKARKYAIYFLHVQPEITVEGMAFDHQDQLNTLRNILAALPADMYLVVKEHSPMLGFRSLNFYDQLLRLPGLIIAPTKEDSHDLILHSSVVVTLTGTVALEAVLYGIPAIVLGSIYFDNFSGIYKADSLDELRALLADPRKLPGATEDEALLALASLLRASKPGKPARVDVSSASVDSKSATVMLSELDRLLKKK